MPRQRIEIYDDEKRQLFVGKFHDLVRSGRPPKRDLCTYRDAKYSNNGKRRRSEKELYLYLRNLWEDKRAELLNEMEIPPEDAQISAYLKETIHEYFDTKINTMSYKYQKEVRYYLLFWLNKLGDLPLNEITPKDIVKIRNNIKVTNATKNRYIAAFSSFFTSCIKEFYILEVNPCKMLTKLKEPRGRTRFLSDSERIALLNACSKIDEELYLLVLLSITTGARRSELINLEWENYRDSYLHFEHTKNDEQRSVPVFGKAKELLDRKKKKAKKIFSKKSYRKPFEKALRNAKIEDFNWHSLRHSCASYLVMNGVPLRTVSDILGHKTLQMVHRYSHLSPEHLRSSIETLQKQVNGL
jgi:integrase